MNRAQAAPFTRATPRVLVTAPQVAGARSPVSPPASWRRVLRRVVSVVFTEVVGQDDGYRVDPQTAGQDDEHLMDPQSDNRCLSLNRVAGSVHIGPPT
jgi:hypothetical protein